MRGIETAISTEYNRYDSLQKSFAQVKKYIDKRVFITALLAILIVKAIFCSDISSLAQTNPEPGLYAGLSLPASTENSFLGYREYASGFNVVYPSREINIGAESCIHYEENNMDAAPIIYTDYMAMPGDSIYAGEKSLIDFAVNVEEEGFYNLSLEYYPLAGGNSNILQSVLIDGEIPCREMARLNYCRVWEVRDDVMSESQEWITSYAYDKEGYVTSPLSVYLTEGEHIISLHTLQAPLLIHQIILNNAGQIQDYKQTKRFWDEVGIKAANRQEICIKAEDATRTSSEILCPVEEQAAPSIFMLNTKNASNTIIGGNSWNQTEQWIEWEFDVEESGYYNISVYNRQNYAKGLGAFRKVMIDGAVPFTEMESYKFKYRKNWKEDTLSDADGTPYVFYLKQGHHSIRLEAVLGDMSDIAGNVYDCVNRLNAVYCQVADIIDAGSDDTNPDVRREYHLSDTLPNLREELCAVHDQLMESVHDMQEMTNIGSDAVKILSTMTNQLEDLIGDEDRLVNEINTFGANICAYSDWVNTITPQPLAIDHINITSPEQKELSAFHAPSHNHTINELRKA